jgi:hypothetical protein
LKYSRRAAVLCPPPDGERPEADASAADRGGFGTTAAVCRFASMNEQAKVCRRKAAECERAALLATESRVQATYRDLVRQCGTHA